MGTKRGLERLIFFMDAVVAIAITLLILPLVDLVPEASRTLGHDPGLFLSEHWLSLLSFAISFVVIARLWLAHHSLFEHVGSYNGVLMSLTLFWAFTIVLLPLPTAMTTAFDPGPTVVAFYVGTMTVNSLTLTLITIVVRGNPRLEAADNPIGVRQFAGSINITVGFFVCLVVALILSFTVPSISYFALFLLAITGPFDRIVTRRIAAREAQHPVRAGD